MIVVKCSDAVECLGDKIYDPLCGRLFKAGDEYIVHGSLKDPDAKINFFTWSKDNDDYIFTGSKNN